MTLIPESWFSIFTLGLTVLVFIAFVKEVLAPELISLVALALLLLSGVLKAGEAIALFGNSAVITIGSMFVLSTALSQTNAIAPLTALFLKASKKGEAWLLGSIFLAGIPLSGFVNNTPLVAILTPVMKRVSARQNISLSRLLIPVSFATILGGTMTLIGTSSNLVVSNAMKTIGLPAFSMFEITGLGLAYGAIGTLYMLTIGRKLLPHHGCASADKQISAEVKKSPKGKIFISVATIVSVVVLAALNVANIEVLAMSGALVVIVCRCISLEQAYRCIPWNLIFLIAGMLGLSIALQRSGAADIIVEGLIYMIGSQHPIIALSLVYLVTSALTEMISNNAVAALLTPIAAIVAMEIGSDPRAFVVAVMFGASASFATPIGYQTNTYIYKEGNYRFLDFVKIGLPLNILLWLTATLVIPLFWPI